MTNPHFSNLNAVYINCILKKSPETSHTSSLLEVSSRIMANENVKVDNIRFVVATCIYPDMTEHNWEVDE